MSKSAEKITNGHMAPSVLVISPPDHAAIRIPFRLLRFALGTRCPAHRMSSYPSGLRANPNRMAGVLPSFSLTCTQLLTVRKTVRYFCTMAGL